jgi:hypothetical protein
VNAGAIWGAIAPARFFGPGSPYFVTLLGFPIGFILPIFPYLLHRAYPNSFWKYVNIPVFCVTTVQAGEAMSSLITPVLIALFCVCT